MDRQKLIHDLFVGKVAEVIGFEKTTKLLRESMEAIDKMLVDIKKAQEIKTK